MPLSKSASEPVLAITPGEPAGIGPDITLAVAGKHGTDGTRSVIVADPDLLARRAELLGLDIAIHDWSADHDLRTGALNVLPVSLAIPEQPGVLDTRNAPYVIDTLTAAVDLCQSGSCDAIVTGPVNKAVINDAGIPFSGHTEWLQERTGASQVVMVLATSGLMVALATTHVPLKHVSDCITRESLTATIEVLHAGMADRFATPAPAILVLGLNPHAGESGHIGTEELETIEPVLDALREKGFRLTGPVPADTAFSPSLLQQHDVVLAMYHDQGLPVLKYKGFGAAANITLGLPIVRTSVDHGTALDIAGTGQAEIGSLETAIDYAVRMTASS